MVTLYLPDDLVMTTHAGTLEEILLRLDMNPYEILVTRDGELLLADDVVNEEDILRATSIVHGG
jgi:sulfur carrier protein